MRNDTHSQIIRLELIGLPRVLIRFLLNPIAEIALAPNWAWVTQFTVVVGSAMISGVLTGALASSFWDFLLGLLILPIVAALSTILISFFIKYFFSAVRHTQLDLKQVHAVVALAYVPFLALHILATIIPPIDLIGFAFTCLLVIVGITEKFNLRKKLVVEMVAAVYLGFSLVWMAAQIHTREPVGKGTNRTQPQTLDQMERDLGSVKK